MNYSCKKCLTIMNEHIECPVCNSVVNVTPLQINYYNQVKKVNLMNHSMLPPFFKKETVANTIIDRVI